MADERCSYDPAKKCLGLEKYNKLENQLAEYRQQARETHKELYGRVTALERSDTARDQQYKTIMEKLDKLLAWQDVQREKPAKRWDAIVEKILLLVVAGVVGAVLARFGIH